MRRKHSGGWRTIRISGFYGCFRKAQADRGHRPYGRRAWAGISARGYLPPDLQLEKVELDTPEGPVLHVLGADLLDGTPILDIKPYLPYADSYPEAAGGFADRVKEYELEVDFPEELRADVAEEECRIICQLLAQDPRPSYQQDPKRVYGMRYADMEVKFTVEDQTVHVVKIIRMSESC